jgi:hypothetical protein
MDQAAREWLTAFGTVGAVLVAVFGTWFWTWWRRPILKMRYEEREPFCRPTMMVDLRDPRAPFPAYWVRVKITNEGRSTARGCKGHMTAVYTPEGKVREDRDPVLLRWSVAGMPDEQGLAPLDLACGESQFLNVAYATAMSPNAAKIPTHPQARPGFPLELEANQRHHVTVVVYSDNAEPTKADFVITYGGTVDSLTMERVTAEVEGTREPQGLNLLFPQ